MEITYARVPEPDREYARLFRPSNSYPNWIETVEVPEAIVELVAAGLGISVLAGWAVATAENSARIVTARVGHAGISVPWFAATRTGEDSEDQRNLQVAEHLAKWCRQRGGLNSIRWRTFISTAEPSRFAGSNRHRFRASTAGNSNSE